MRLQAGSADTANSSLRSRTESRFVRVLIVGRAASSGALTRILEAKGYSVSTARNSAEALEIVDSTEPELILLDSLPADSDGWQLLTALHARSAAPILSLIDPADISMIETGLQRGIEDFVAKPAEADDLGLRIHVALLNAERRRQQSVPRERRSGGDRRKARFGRRRSDRQKLPGACKGLLLTAGPFTINDQCKRILVEGEERHLGPKEYNLLKLLVAVPGRVISNEEIIACLWPQGSRATASDVQQYVHLLRGKVEKDPKKPRWIETVKGFGYRLSLAEADTK